MNCKQAITELYRYYDSYSRLPHLLEMQQNGKLRSKTFFQVLGEIWSYCDNINVCSDLADVIYDQVWDHVAAGTMHVQAMMTREEQLALAALPAKVEVYRGCGPVNRDGYSWTLDRKVAERFPRMARYHQDDPLLLKATIDRSQIAALKLDRNESEVILFILPNDEEIEEEALSFAA